MPDSNTQNTSAGTPNGGDLVGDNGNPFLAALNAVSNVANTALTSVSSFAERFAILKAEVKGQNAPPAQTTPAYQANTLASYVSNPDNVKSMLIFGAIVLVAISVVRKVIK